MTYRALKSECLCSAVQSAILLLVSPVQRALHPEQWIQWTRLERVQVSHCFTHNDSLVPWMVEGKEVNRQALHLLNEPWDGEWKGGLEEWTREVTK